MSVFFILSPNTWHTVGAQLVFVHRDPAASRGLCPGSPDELRVDYHMIGLLPQQRWREGKFHPRAQAQAEERAPKSLSVGCACVSLLFLLPCATVAMAPWLLLIGCTNPMASSG